MDCIKKLIISTFTGNNHQVGNVTDCISILKYLNLAEQALIIYGSGKRYNYL